MTHSRAAPSALESGAPCIRVLLVTPATTTLSSSSKSTTAGRFLTSKVSVNCPLARTTSPGLNILPGLVFRIVPQFLHFGLLPLVQELIFLVPLPECRDHAPHPLEKVIISLPGIFPQILQGMHRGFVQLDGGFIMHQL